MKKVIKFLADEFVYGAHLLSLGAASIVLSVLLIFDLKINIVILIIAYLIYQIIYTYNHFRELLSDMKTNPERAKHLSDKQKWVKVSPFIYLLSLIIVLLYTNWLTSILTAFITIGGILYTEYFKKVQILGFKSYYVAFFWAMVILLVPFFYNIENMLPFLYLAIFTFIRWLVNTIFFDIKDIKSDGDRRIKTIPVRLGKERTIYILQIINLISFVPLILGVYNGNLPKSSLFLGIAVVIGAIYLTRALNLNEKKLRTLSYVVVDGEYLLWPVLILISKLFI